MKELVFSIVTLVMIFSSCSWTENAPSGSQDAVVTSDQKSQLLSFTWNRTSLGHHRWGRTVIIDQKGIVRLIEDDFRGDKNERQRTLSEDERKALWEEIQTLNAEELPAELEAQRPQGQLDIVYVDEFAWEWKEGGETKTKKLKTTHQPEILDPLVRILEKIVRQE